MAWSTRELAEIAGTTVNTVRHYHALGILEDPERQYNGYKLYRVHHLVSLLRTRRLAELGVPLSQIGANSAGDVAADPTVLRRLDAEFEADIERLRRVRADIAAILRVGAPADAPRGFERVASRLSRADRSLLHLYTRLHDEDAIAALHRMVDAEPESVREQFAMLRSDADETTRRRIAQRIAATGANWRTADLSRPGHVRGHLRRSEHIARQTLAAARVELYNTAQRDVLERASAYTDCGTAEAVAC